MVAAFAFAFASVIIISPYLLCHEWKRGGGGGGWFLISLLYCDSRDRFAIALLTSRFLASRSPLEKIRNNYGFSIPNIVIQIYRQVSGS